MDGAPWFDKPDQFDQGRIQLADTGGTGVTDILYLDRGEVRIFLNRSGNSFAPACTLRTVPAIDSVGVVSVTDLLGRGTACRVWSSPLPHEAGRPVRYIDLDVWPQATFAGAGGHQSWHGDPPRVCVLDRSYMSPTKRAGPGVMEQTRLPFPVHARRTNRNVRADHVGRNRFVRRYSYHHGYYDGIEREFRGFGRVDLIDTEDMATLSESGDVPTGENIDTASHMPPVLTPKLVSQYWRFLRLRKACLCHPRPRILEVIARRRAPHVFASGHYLLPAGLTPGEARMKLAARWKRNTAATGDFRPRRLTGGRTSLHRDGKQFFAPPAAAAPRGQPPCGVPDQRAPGDGYPELRAQALRCRGCHAHRPPHVARDGSCLRRLRKRSAIGGSHRDFMDAASPTPRRISPTRIAANRRGWL